jgi:hypothetical protein
MLPEKVYMDVAEDFGVSVGVAHAIHKGVRELQSREEIRDYNDDRYISGVVLRCIEKGRYNDLQRTIYRIKQQAGKRKLKEVTIYKKAWYYIVNGHDKRNNTKSGKVLEESR